MNSTIRKVNIKFCIPNKVVVGYKLKGTNKIIKSVRYTSFEQQCNKRCSIIFTDSTSVEVKDTEDIEVE